jgi:uncharacterized protein (TIGR03086 family)
MTGSLSAQAAYARGVETFDAVLRRVGTDQWTAATPCVEWDVRTLVNHVVGEDRWVPPLLAGLTIAEVGDTLAGDLLGDDPQLAWDRARHEAEGAVSAVPDDRTVALSAGPTPVAEYLWQLAADHLIHAWDLATAVGIELVFDDDLAAAVEDWFRAREDGYRQAGAIGPRVAVPDGASRQQRLLAAFGRSVVDWPAGREPTYVS